MTIHELQVLCLIMLLFAYVTICIDLNDAKRITRKECRAEIYYTNSLIVRLEEDQKYQLVRFLVNEHESVGMVDYIFPPGNYLLRNFHADDAIYGTIYENEKRIQKMLTYILDPDQAVHLGGECSYGTEVELRSYHLNAIFRHTLNVRLKTEQMCVNGQSMKCVLVGLIKRTLKYKLRNKAQCENDGSCTITSVDWTTVPISFDDLPQTKETYRDVLYDDKFGYYQTLFQASPNRPESLVGWYSVSPKVVKSGPSAEE
ncbi:uncharacterized protein LOC126846187 [Adelges cooleyi]|uniref:uncharacterized protein LOC126846187 n=1 Tax=Adelges cooleyi TaxID=133065 RepID=UPI002180082A|nr:uncharacterized protein LOC126846187 [Adelges cooleyi]